MKKYLLDSNTLNLYVFRRKNVHDRARAELKSGAVVGTTMPVVAEILGGTRASSTAETNLPIVEQKLRKVRIWPFDFAAAAEYGRLYAELRANGITIQPVDLMLAAVAKLLPNCTVVTTDSDLSRVPGLRVEDWTS